MIQNVKRSLNSAIQYTAIAGAIACTDAKADFHAYDLTAGNNAPQVRLLDTMQFGKLTFEGFNQGTKDWYFGDNAIFYSQKPSAVIQPMAKFFATQDGFSHVVPGVRFAVGNATLDAGYYNSGLHMKAMGGTQVNCFGGGFGLYLTQIVNAAPRQKPYSLSEIEVSKMFAKHAGLVGRVSWENFSGKPKIEGGVRYAY